MFGKYLFWNSAAEVLEDIESLRVETEEKLHALNHVLESQALKSLHVEAKVCQEKWLKKLEELAEAADMVMKLPKEVDVLVQSK